MSQSNGNPQYTWSEQHQRYYEYILVNSQWVHDWKPVGWQPPQQQAHPHGSPQSYGPNDSAYGSSPAAFTSPGQASWSNTATPASAGPAQWNYSTQPANHLFHQSAHSSGPSDQSSLPSGPGYHYGNNAPRQRFPKGEGDEIYGYYNAKLGNTPGNLHYEEVDPSFYVRDRKFFQEGKVFAVIFSETAGSTATSYNSSLSEARFTGHFVHTQSRRFVVVRQKREFCYACPIFTYSNRATTKRGVRPEEHGIAYSNGQEPKLLRGEKGIKKRPIAVVMTQDVPMLHIASRIYYGIHHPIQYNVKVKDIGQVQPHHLPILIGNWKAEDAGETRQAAEVTASAEEPELPYLPEEYEGESDDESSPMQHAPPSPTSYKDPHLYHPKNNVYGYDAKINPHMYHPIQNQYGYHPKNNTHGFHPQSNQCGYHPKHNPHGYHPQKTPFCYHPQFSPYGYHGHLNVHGYHPDVTPFNFHPHSNYLGYHPTHNAHGYHPQHNPYGYHPDQNPHGYHSQHHPYGYHPTHNPNDYHPKWNPNGTFYQSAEAGSGEQKGEGG